MPEGPSIVILREAVEALHLKGKTVQHASGNAKIDMQRLERRKLLDVMSWGKHFLLCFSGFTVRIHLMMFGSYRINERKENVPRLSLQFKGAELNFYTCSIKLLEGDAKDLYDWTADVMSPEWAPKLALKKLKEHPTLKACDALLQQDIFSGSGNIIKNEVLFRTRIHPLSEMGKIPPAKLKEMVDEASRYSFDFLEWKKAFVLKQHWLAYTRKICPRCNIPFKKEYLGVTKRRTFYCDNCQSLYL